MASTGGLGCEAMERDPSPVKMIVIGAGSRGKTYSKYAIEYPSKLQVVGVAEPRSYHREYMRSTYRIPEENVFTDWKDIAARDKFADAVLISTQDQMHRGPAVAFAKKGYHILLEKPMAVTAEDCKMIVSAVKEAGVILAVGHVLRYTPYMQKIKELLRSGIIGDIVNIQHLEPIGSWHFAHSYVRGNWRREDESSFMLMAKCCHDVDLIRYMIGEPCVQVSSMGSLKHFRKENKPPGAGSRCLDCAVEADCAYSAKSIYLDPVRAGDKGWPINVITPEPTIESVTKVLKEGPYGRCVYECDNDVVDHQVVNFQFKGGATATLTTVAFTERQCQRHTRIYGTKGELEGDGDRRIRHYDFLRRKSEVFTADLPPEGTCLRGHNGADFFLIKAFVEAVSRNDPTCVLSGPDETLESHMMVFAAEAARLERRVVELAPGGVMAPAGGGGGGGDGSGAVGGGGDASIKEVEMADCTAGESELA